jgi:hypothetical protein
MITRERLSVQDTATVFDVLVQMITRVPLHGPHIQSLVL